MTEVYINNYLIELAESKISQTFQLNDVGDLANRQTSYTNKFKAPKTPKNVKTMNYLGLVGKAVSKAPYSFPYKRPSAKIVEEGIEIVSNGYAVVSDDDENYYNIVIYGGEKNFFEAIKDLTIQDVYPNTLFTYTVNNLNNAMERTSNFVFSVLLYNNFTRTWANNQNEYLPTTLYYTERMTPQFFLKDLFKYIFDYLGYEVVHNFDEDVLWEVLLTNASQSVVNFDNKYGDTFNLKKVAPTFKCTDLIKELMIWYCAFIDVDEFNQKVIFTKFKDIANSDAEDWSDKFSSLKKQAYRINGYGKKNSLLFGSDALEDYDRDTFPETGLPMYYDGDNNENSMYAVHEWNWSTYFRVITDELTGVFNLDIDDLEAKKEIYKSIFSKPKLAYQNKNHQRNENYISFAPTVPASVKFQHKASYGLLPVGKVNTQYYLSLELHEMIDLLEYEYEYDKDVFGEDTSPDKWYEPRIEFSKFSLIKSKIQKFEPYIFYKKTLEFNHVFGLTDANGNYVYFTKSSVHLAKYKTAYRNYAGPQEVYVHKRPAISFQNLLNNYYYEFIQTIDKPNIVNALLKLSIVDIYLLNFSRKKYIKQLGGNFYLNKVKDFKRGSVTECELIKIPPMTESQYYNNTQMIGTL